MTTPNSFSIRPLTAADEPFLWEMLYHAIHVPEGQELPPRSILQEPRIAHYASRWGQRPGDLGLAAVDAASGQPVGAAWLRLFPLTDPGYGFVDADTPEVSIAMLPGYRGRGLGSRLMTALLASAAERYKAVSLSVSPDNAAKNLYERMGFVQVDVDGDALTMVKRFA